MGIQYKQKCCRCRKNYVVMCSRQQYAVCYDCQKSELEKKIKDPKMKKFFNLPDQYYKDNSFLRSIKINYLQYGRLTERQVEAFKKAVEKIKEEKCRQI